MVDAELRRVEATDAAQIHFDLSQLDFIDLTGVRVLVEAAARARRDSDRLVVIARSRQVERLLGMTGIDRHIRGPLLMR